MPCAVGGQSRVLAKADDTKSHQGIVATSIHLLFTLYFSFPFVILFGLSPSINTREKKKKKIISSSPSSVSSPSSYPTQLKCHLCRSLVKRDSSIGSPAVLKGGRLLSEPILAKGATAIDLGFNDGYFWNSIGTDRPGDLEFLSALGLSA